jgi:predicted signal transduction protein with EAL and GGDEF domain|tara:strand:- start:846 stop:1127 length:282 start_codon:yes stop_codon:yes gene_type:complete
MRFNVTFGVSDYPVHSVDYNTLLLHSNIAVETALKNNQVVQNFNADVGAYHQRRLTITRRLEQALEHDELTFYYQPKQQLSDGRVQSCECLLR